MKNLVQLPAEFDYNLLTHALRDYKKPRDKIRGLIKNKDIIRVKKGIYVLGEDYGKPYNRFILANLIYGPSYVSGQTALAYWNMIPERVELMISMTAKRKKQYETPVGRFSYYYCPPKAFNMGVRLEDAGEGKKILIASPEKALCDVAALQAHITTQEEMAEFIELMRLDLKTSENLDFALIEKINAGYQRRSVRMLSGCLKDHV